MGSTQILGVTRPSRLSCYFQFYSIAETLKLIFFYNSNRIQLSNMEESPTSVVGDKHPAVSRSQIVDRATNMS